MCRWNWSTLHKQSRIITLPPTVLSSWHKSKPVWQLNVLSAALFILYSPGCVGSARCWETPVCWCMQFFGLSRCFCVLQLGGTVGDIESMPFIEAFRQFQFKVKRENFCNIHVSLIPQVLHTGERMCPILSFVTHSCKHLSWVCFCVLSPIPQESRKPNRPRTVSESSEAWACLQI